MIFNQPHKSARKAKGDGHLRRAEILRAAERIFVAEGYEGATIRKIADEVGVSSTALYMHFRDKDQILLEICTVAMEQLAAINSEICARPVDSVSRVRMMLEAYVRFALDHPNAYRLVFCASPLADFRAPPAAPPPNWGASASSVSPERCARSPPRGACAPATPAPPPRPCGPPATAWSP